MMLVTHISRKNNMLNVEIMINKSNLLCFVIHNDSDLTKTRIVDDKNVILNAPQPLKTVRNFVPF